MSHTHHQASPTDPAGRIRVLQVVHGLVAGGIETWLVNVLRAIDRDRFQLDFLVSAERPCFYDEEVRELGSRLIYCPAPKRPWIYAPALLRILRRQGPYQVVHTHLDHYGGFVLRVAQWAGVPQRIAHSHSDTSARQARAGRLRRLYLGGTKRWLRRSATLGLAVSEKAGASLFPNWGSDPRWRVAYCGIDTEALRYPPQRAAIRARHELPAGAIVLGHVGGFREPKNHAFLLEIAAAAVARNPQVRLLLVGDGPLRPQIEARIRELGLQRHVVLTGVVPDPKVYLRDLIDVFVFPSLWEGLPLAVVESQAAGLPTIISDRISHEVDLVPGLVRQLPLTESADSWAECVLAAVSAARPSPADALARIEASPFSMRQSVQALEAIYASH